MSDHATGMSFTAVMSSEIGQQWVVGVIQYWDRYEKRGERWLFSRRRVAHAFYAADALTRPTHGADADSHRVDAHGPFPVLPDAWPSWNRFGSRPTPASTEKSTLTEHHEHTNHTAFKTRLLGGTKPTLSRWLLADGIKCRSWSIHLYELESEKSVQEIESPATGILKILKPAGDTYPVGLVIGEIT